jgi:polyisoprenyl-teichoic acid--peptidoglycan teichoic acid transferase
MHSVTSIFISLWTPNLKIFTFHRYNTYDFSITKREKDNMNNRKKKIVILSVIMIILLGSLTYFGRMFYKAKHTLEDIYVPIEKNAGPPLIASKSKEEIKKKRPISLLLLGIDGVGNNGSRSDTLIVMTMNPTKGTITMLSIPRDSRTEIIGKGKKDKINHAYAYGGPQMAVDTVEHFLDIPIDYFVSVNMEGFKEIVDIFGGIEVTNDFPFSYDGHSFGTGNLSLNGEEALAYVRMRKEDPRGDLGRNERQKQIIEGLMQKGASITSVSKAKEILDTIGNNVKTNIQLRDMKTLQQYYSESKDNIQILYLDGRGQMINHVWYYIVNEDSKKRISDELKKQLTSIPSENNVNS